MKQMVIFIAVLLLIHAVSAQGVIGVSPGSITFKQVLRGGYAERPITITANTQNSLEISAEARGEIAEWLNFSKNITTDSTANYRMIISVLPPSDVPNGNYTGFARISTTALDDGAAGGAVSRILAVLDVAITVEITDYEIKQCLAKEFSVSSAEEGDNIDIGVRVYNEGNVRIRPEVTLDIWDQEQLQIVSSEIFRGGEIFPTRDEILNFSLSTRGYDIDQYWVDVRVPECYSEQTLTFDVLEEGALKAEGVLTKIVGPVWSEVGDTLPITAFFRNTGEKDVEARFKGQITKEDKIVQVYESEPIEAPMDTISNFTFFFTPESSGRYVASGRIYYDKKRTFESSTVLNVASRPFMLSKILLYGVYMLMVGAIIFLIFKVRITRKKYLEKLRRAKYEY